MSWMRLLKEKRVERRPPDKGEIDELRSLAARNLADASIDGLSADGRFSMAYDAVRTLATMAIRCAGYRVRAGHGSHHNTFQALQAAMGSDIAKDIDYFEACRQKRNDLSYDAAHVTSETEANELLEKAASLTTRIDDWIARNYPNLAG